MEVICTRSRGQGTFKKEEGRVNTLAVSDTEGHTYTHTGGQKDSGSSKSRREGGSVQLSPDLRRHQGVSSSNLVPSWQPPGGRGLTASHGPHPSEQLYQVAHSQTLRSCPCGSVLCLSRAFCPHNLTHPDHRKQPEGSRKGLRSTQMQPHGPTFKAWSSLRRTCWGHWGFLGQWGKAYTS